MKKAVRMAEQSVLASWAPVVSWVLVFFGWRRVTKENDRRQKRKEIRERLDSVLDLLDQLEDLTRDYYTSVPGPSADELSGKIKALLSKIGFSIALLAKMDVQYACGMEWTKVRVAITGGDFDSQKRQPMPSNDDFFLVVSDAVIAVIRKLDSAFALSE